jgi:hypothetical protein
MVISSDLGRAQLYHLLSISNLISCCCWNPSAAVSKVAQYALRVSYDHSRRYQLFDGNPAVELDSIPMKHHPLRNSHNTLLRLVE